MIPSTKKTPARKFFVYIRKSTESEDRQVLSRESQRDEAIELGKRYGVKLIKPFYVESMSAKKPGRPVFSEMMGRVAEGEADGIVCWKLDRLARNPIDGGAVIWAINQQQVDIITYDKYYKHDEDNTIMLYLEFGMAHDYVKKLSKNVKRGNKTKFFTKKEWIGVAPPGYLNRTDPIHKINYITVDKKRFPLLQKAARLIISGDCSVSEAWDKLNNDWGYRSPQRSNIGNKPLSYSRFHKFLKNTFYYGLMVRKEGQVMGTHERMFTEEEWNLLQKRIGNFNSHYTKHEFPYKQVLKCGECGGSITCQKKVQIICPECKKKFHKSKKRTKCPKCNLKIDDMKGHKVLEYVYFSCTKKTTPTCSQGSIEIKQLEKQILAELSKFEIDEDWRDYAIKYLNELNDQEAVDQQAIRNNLLSEKNKTDHSLQRLLDVYLSPDNKEHLLLSEEEYLDRKSHLQNHQNRLKRQIDELDIRQNDWMELSAMTFDFACYAKHWFNEGDAKTKTRILATLGKNLVIRDKKLLIDQHKPFFLIKKAKDEVAEYIEKLEPKEKIDLSTNTAYLDHLHSTWRRGWDSNPRSP